MSSAVEASVRARGRGLWVALALSLTLNIFVLGGLGWSILMRPPPPGGGAQRLVQIGRSLDLTGDQRDALRKFGTDAREAMRSLRQANVPIIREMWTEMAKPQPDQAKLQELTDQVLANRRTYQHGMSEKLLAFLAVLTPEQRQRFVESAMRPPGERRR